MSDSPDNPAPKPSKPQTLAPPRGMRDFYPEDFRARQALFDAWAAAGRAHAFEVFDAPVVETLELLQRKAGEEIADQIYTFQDKSGRDLALRPELTPSLARVIIARQGALAFPLKWSAIAQCFRYERTTRGRKREHYQWNLDIVGEPSILAEVEVLSAATGALAALGLTPADAQVRVGSRALLAALFTASGLAADHFLPCCLALDKRGKITDDQIRELLAKEGLAPADIDRVFALLAINSLEGALGALPDTPEAAGAAADLRTLFELAGQTALGPWLTFDLAVIRGLGYYTGIVFEAFDTQGKFRAIFGGGRYDRLLSDLGGPQTPCVGLGFGDVVIAELLGELGRAPSSKRSVDLAIGYMNEECRPFALQLATAARSGQFNIDNPTVTLPANPSVDLALTPEKPRKFFTRADRSGAVQASYIGPDEASNGTFTLKTLATGETVEAKLPPSPNP